MPRSIKGQLCMSDTMRAGPLFILFKFFRFSHPSSDLSLFSNSSLYGSSYVRCSFFSHFFVVVSSTLDVIFPLFFFSLLRLKRTLESATKGIFQITSAADIYIYIYICFFCEVEGVQRAREREKREWKERNRSICGCVCPLRMCVCIESGRSYSV